jgi:hypothetical protein
MKGEVSRGEAAPDVYSGDIYEQAVVILLIAAPK